MILIIRAFLLHENLLICSTSNVCCMKIFTAPQIKNWDSYTIKHQPVSSIALMEKAGEACAEYIVDLIREKAYSGVMVFCGPGNNGGDGLVIARYLYIAGISTEVYLVGNRESYSLEYSTNMQRMKTISHATLITLENEHHLPEIPEGTVVIDALFGTGLNKPVVGIAGALIRHINRSTGFVVSIDIASGLPAEYQADLMQGEPDIIRPNLTLTFQQPKLTFFLADCAIYTGVFEVIDLGLHPDYAKNEETPFFYITQEEWRKRLHERVKFSHKGTYGHAWIAAGSYGKVGAAILGSRAALRAGCGLVTTYVPRCAYQIVQTALPEAMVTTDEHEHHISNMPHPEFAHALAAGPGLGTHEATGHALLNWLKLVGNTPLVLDADALNIIAGTGDDFVYPANCIITPHVKEFERLAGVCSTAWERISKQREYAQKNNIVVVLKGAHTSVALPDGRVFFNSSGNPALATAGAGDVLTGVMVSLLAQGYSAEDAAVVGVYWHGASADMLVSEEHITLLASEVADALPVVKSRMLIA